MIPKMTESLNIRLEKSLKKAIEKKKNANFPTNSDVARALLELGFKALGRNRLKPE